MRRPQGCHSLEIAEVQRCIYVIRDAQVMLDRDLAALYGVEVKQLNRQVKRNIERFPSDFMFQLSKEECSRCQIGTLNGNRGSNVKYLPYAFTENDVATLDVLSKKRPGVKVRLVCKNRGLPTQTEIAKFNRQYKGLTVSYSDDFHDRFLVIDQSELYGLGSSVNSLGRRVTSYSTHDAREIAKLLAMIP